MANKSVFIYSLIESWVDEDRLLREKVSDMNSIIEKNFWDQIWYDKIPLRSTLELMKIYEIVAQIDTCIDEERLLIWKVSEIDS